MAPPKEKTLRNLANLAAENKFSQQDLV